MTQQPDLVNGAGGTAPLQNVGLCLSALEKAAKRPGHLPGMVVLYGPSGYGKSTAAAYVATRLNAYYVEARSSWTQKAMLEAILCSMDIRKGRPTNLPGTPKLPIGPKSWPVQPARTLAGMIDQAAEQLAGSGRPLIIDEMDHVVERNAVELVRDLYEASRAAILLIGEEALPGKLAQWERFHGRILDWVAAQPADLDDGKALRSMYCDRVGVADDLLADVVSAAEGSVRRICVNLERIQEQGQLDGLDVMDRAAWAGRPLYTGRAPRRGNPREAPFRANPRGALWGGRGDMTALRGRQPDAQGAAFLVWVRR